MKSEIGNIKYAHQFHLIVIAKPVSTSDINDVLDETENSQMHVI